jgi:hypothetical protein
MKTNLNLTNLLPRTVERIEKYSKIAYNGLGANLDEWQKNPNCKDTIRGVTRIYYDLVHALSIPSGYITVKALETKRNDPKWPVCKDHCYSPQFIGRMIMDNPEIYLGDYDIFRETFYTSCKTIEITSEENRNLSNLTSNNKGNFKVYIPTDKKYKHLNIKLVERNTGRYWYNQDVNYVDNYIITPNELLEYEKKFLVN